MTIDGIVRELTTAASALYDAFADSTTESGEPLIEDSDTLDDFIEIMDIISRVESRKVRELKREYESIL